MIIIYSFGGCGTRTLYEFIKKYKKVNGPVDVHRGFIKYKYPQDKVIYLYGNPMEAVMSFYNRHQKDGRFVFEHSRNLNIPVVQSNTLSGYIQKGEDQFKLENHFDRYIKKSKSFRFFSIMYIKYEYMWENLPEILKYTGLHDKIDNFPQKKNRQSKLNTLSDFEYEKLYKIYENLILKMEKLPPVIIK